MIVLGFESSCDETGVALRMLSILRHPPPPVGYPRALHSQIDAPGFMVVWCPSRPAATISSGCRPDRVSRLTLRALPSWFTRSRPGLVRCWWAWSVPWRRSLGKPVLGVHHRRAFVVARFECRPKSEFSGAAGVGGNTQPMVDRCKLPHSGRKH
jgi:hypothetical protein